MEDSTIGEQLLIFLEHFSGTETNLYSQLHSRSLGFPNMRINRNITQIE